MRRLILLALVLASFSADAQAPAPAATGALLAPYSATYTVLRGRMRVGEMAATLESAGSGQWIYRSQTRTTGLASLLKGIEIVETSEFRIEHGRVVPIVHRYVLTGDKRNRNFTLAFDWVTRRVQGDVAGTPLDIEIEAGAVDRHAMPLAVAIELMQGAAYPAQHVMVDRARLRHYDSRVDGEETLRTEIGAIHSVRVVQQRVNDPSRRFVIWYAKDRGYIPVRIQSVDDDGATVSLDLKSLAR